MGLSEVSDMVQQLVVEAASGWWTLLALFGFVAVNGFFPMLPSDSLLITLGSVQDEAGTPWWPWVILVSAAAALLGDFIAYQIGRIIGIDRFGWMRRPAPQRTLRWARHELDKRGVLVIFVGRFIPGARVAINFVAGSTGYSKRRFLLIDGAASLLWAGWLTSLGVVGDAIFGNLLVAMVVGIGVAILLGLLAERLFAVLAQWLDHRGVQIDPEGYQDTSNIPVQSPIRRRRDKDDGDPQAHRGD